MNKIPKNLTYPWYHNEFKQMSDDFTDIKEVEIYDSRMQEIRDIEGETQTINKAIQLKTENIVIEIGSGTSNYSITTAKQCKNVIALDISQTMIDYSKKKALKSGVSNITFIQKGFLTYEHQGQPVDAVVTSLALHHLTEFWKQIAFFRINQMLKLRGKFYLQDIIITFPPLKFEEELIRWFNETSNQDNKEARYAVIREELPSFDWSIEKMILNAGFKILNKDTNAFLFTTYLCEKITELN